MFFPAALPQKQEQTRNYQQHKCYARDSHTGNDANNVLVDQKSLQSD